MGRVKGKVAVITGAARDQGRSHTLLFLASDEARYVTGQVFGVHLGSSIK
ncbi:hypothetical protein [Pseudofrankia sp. BMG5.37]|nr:hypothetical protein [Pseudofrankia sp. BMG5.37]MDT3441900.1 hypothetical protein [Pseudofrankia sp. BMG5.37]